MDQSDFVGAQKQMTIALDYTNAHFPKDNYHRLYIVNLLGDIFYQSQDYQQATEYFEQVLAHNNSSKVKNQKQQVGAYIGLGRVSLKLKEFITSQEYLDKALNLSLSIYGINHSVTASIYFELAQLSLEQGRPYLAIDQLKKALEIQKLILPTQHKDLLSTGALLKSLKLKH